MCIRVNSMAAETDRWMLKNGLSKDVHSFEWEQHFAELLIRECAELCAINDPEQAEILLEHFGVE